ncbi:hypothetical protein F5B18DRAFT_647156 [Nemania serpens]|nr:hypothetical protein F5B18DRAFT_647156 [Nemania serpens]
MSSHPSATPAKVPASAATYTPATQDADLRSQINTILLREGHSTKIQEYFLHSLDAHSSNWPSAIQSHALALLRSGEINTFPALVRRVLEDVQRDAAAAASASNPSSTANTQTSSSTSANEPTATGKDGVNGAAAVNGANKAASGANGASAGADGTAGLALPTAVVEAVLKVVRDSLEAVCEIEPDGSAGG